MQLFLSVYLLVGYFVVSFAYKGVGLAEELREIADELETPELEKESFHQKDAQELKKEVSNKRQLPELKQEAFHKKQAPESKKEESKEREITKLKEQWSKQREQWMLRRGTLDCNELGDSCKGVIRCCGTLQCYWSDGYSLVTAGKCVTCVERSQMCQRDTQCCSPLVCQKGKRTDINGRCEDRRPNGSECHENDQCQSANCVNDFTSSVVGYGGECKQASG